MSIKDTILKAVKSDWFLAVFSGLYAGAAYLYGVHSTEKSILKRFTLVKASKNDKGGYDVQVYTDPSCSHTPMELARVIDSYAAAGVSMQAIAEEYAKLDGKE